jgi:CSLREA domain-containing protein
MVDDDAFACFSNYGPLVEIAAPGVKVRSTYNNNGYGTLSGTSMAAPHVAGAAALDILEHGKPTDAGGAAAVRARVVAAGAPQDGPSGFRGDPDSFHEPLLSAASAGAYDASVTAVTAPPAIVPGNLAQIDVSLSHDATTSHSLSVSLTASGGTVLDSPQTVVLEPHSPGAVSFTWDNTGVAPADYYLSATVTGPPGDLRANNNWASISATVRAPEHNVAVAEVDAPSAVLEQSEVQVHVTATNPGTFSETFAVSLEASGGTIEGSPQAIALIPGESGALSFTWHAPGARVDPHVLTAAAGAVPGEESISDNSLAVDVLVTELQVIVVNSSADTAVNVCDATECTLREAITLANVTPGPARIEFNIPPGARRPSAPCGLYRASLAH